MFSACSPPGLSLVFPPCSPSWFIPLCLFPPCSSPGYSPVFVPCCPRGCPLCHGFGMCLLLAPLLVYHPWSCAWKLILDSALLLMQCRSCPRNVGCACILMSALHTRGFGSSRTLAAMQECRACALWVLLLPPCARGLRLGTKGCMSLP